MGVSVRLEKITKRYGATTAVSDINLAIRAGEFVSLLGPSGSGKSTLLLLIAGILAPSAGTLYFDDKAMTAVPSNKRGIGIVFQNYSLFPHLTVFENVAFPLRVRHMADAEMRSRVADALTTVNLCGFEDRRPRQLSGGQQQRVALARALIYRPALLLLDEPLAALDKRLREQMQSEIRRLHRAAGVTTIHVTHDQDEALAMSDRIVVMSNGSILQVGSPQEIYDRPANPFVADFIGASNQFVGEVIRLDDHAAVAAVSGIEVPMRMDGPIATGSRFRASLRPERIVLAPYSVSSPAARSDGEALRGTVIERTFAGDSLTYRVRVGDGWHLVVKRSRDGKDIEFGTGDNVLVRWTMDDVQILEML